jgi:glutathione synthase/RimK-type ligase-like ATP-grasp enzyme
MKIAIHKSCGSFSDRWIKYCKENNIIYKTVNCYDSDIINQLNDCDGLMWHWTLNDYRAELIIRQITHSFEKKGLKVFPDINTGWHYDDKVGQKYLLEAIDAPLAKSYVFYSKQDALNWLNTTSFPKVFKLRTGASSSNVRLVKNIQEAKKKVNKAFGHGFPNISRVGRLKERLYKFKRNKDLTSAKLLLGGIVRLFIPREVEKFSHREKGYVYFQDFIPDNDFDTRLIVIGNRCFGIKRYCRKNDFRASGSGVLSHLGENADKRMIELAFGVADKLKAQSIAFDFVYEKNIPKIVELSYCFAMGNIYEKCPGIWDSSLIWHEGEVNPQKFMIEDFIQSLSKG